MEETNLTPYIPNQSPSIGKLAEALAKAQSEMEGAKTDSENPFFRSKYADLASVWDACRKPLTGHGLSVIQTTDNENGKVIIFTTLIHSSGEWIRGKLAIKPVKDDPQALGSAITYGRRYSLAAIAGISPEDDDAEGSMGRDKGKTPLKEPQTKGERMSQSQGLTIVNIETKTGTKKDGKPWTKYIVTDSNDIHYDTFSESLMAKAEEAMNNNLPITIKSKDNANPKFNKELIGIEAVELKPEEREVAPTEDTTDELTPEHCYELLEVYKGMIAEINTVPDLVAWNKANSDTIGRIEAIQPEVVVSLRVAYDRRKTELKGGKI